MTNFNQKFILGLTGPTGCGKTQASKFLQNYNFIAINADKIVKNLYLNSKNLVKTIDLNFKGVVKNGKLNNQKLAEIVFSSEAQRLKLENIVWPYVIRKLENLIKQIKNFNIIIDAPTLFESGADKFCDFNIAILSSKQKRLRRIIKRDSLTEAMALNRINSQKTDSFYINKADGLIINNGLKSSLFYSLIYLIKKLKISNF